MKKIFAFLIAAAMMLGTLCSCESALITEDTENTASEAIETQEDAVTKEETDTKQQDETDFIEDSSNPLNGKKVIFIGNSHTYYGNTVIVKSNDVLTQDKRDNDMGYFYQICKQNGAKVSVTNWTFGNHAFSDTFGVCDAQRACSGVKHQDYLVDRNYDYVIMQQRTTDMSPKSFHASVKLVTEVFREANPNVKFVMLVSRRAYEHNLEWTEELDTLEDQGFIIADWGRLVNDLILGNTTVPNAKESYNQNSFIISKSSADGYHPNLLTGYITSLMTYCAITGESAVGQDYLFCSNSSIDPKYSFQKFISSYYTYKGATTNFPEIFASEDDMRGIQQLIDTYLSQKPYRN